MTTEAPARASRPRASTLHNHRWSEAAAYVKQLGGADGNERLTNALALASLSVRRRRATRPGGGDRRSAAELKLTADVARRNK